MAHGELDRAVAKLPPELAAGKRTFLALDNLACIDKPYVVQRLRAALRDRGARVVESATEAELVLEVASGALSINRRDMLLGLPALPLPLPFADQVLKIPEFPLLKMITYRGRAKLLFSPFAPETGAQTGSAALYYGKCRETHWWFLFLGPITSSTMPDEER